MIGVTTHTYTIKQFSDGNGSIFEVLVHSSVTNVMEALIKGYRYNRKPNPYRNRPKVKLPPTGDKYWMNPNWMSPPRYVMTASGPVRAN
jgi:hypothetical protein